MEIELRKVKNEEKDILFRLLQFSLYEESATDGNEMNAQGIFEYQWFENYFIDDDRDALFIVETESEKILGFAMINTYTQYFISGHSIAEFMILPKYRRNKIGEQAAIMCFDKYLGNWEVSPAFGSEVANLFWKSVIGKYTNGIYKIKDALYVFENNDI